MRVISTEKKPIKLWLEYLEDGAMEQVRNIANLPFTYKHVAIMPDSHQGYGMPIGGVLATEGVIIPNAVGVDIGCGMCAVKTSITDIDTETLKKIMGEIRKVIPVGFSKHDEMQNDTLMPKTMIGGEKPIVLQEYANARSSLGTLGGGNHFIEIQKGSDGHVWIMVHSGSRNLGLKVAGHYNKLAVELNKKWETGVPESYGLAFLPSDTEEGMAYIREMTYCVEFAFASRKLMMDRVKNAFLTVLNEEGVIKEGEGLDLGEMINIAHNYASLENHFGKNVWVHRKGATLATKDTLGIIPGSQGTKSYIVKGKGNPDSFNSCSHGAGRLMSRSKAKENLVLEDEIKILDDMGVVHGMRNITDLDEAPSAYKDIHKVMEDQKDLVDIVVELTPLAVVKG